MSPPKLFNLIITRTCEELYFLLLVVNIYLKRKVRVLFSQANISQLKSTTVEISISQETLINQGRFVMKRDKTRFHHIFLDIKSHFSSLLMVLFGIHLTKLHFVQ
jgi:hypothetical protein